MASEPAHPAAPARSDRGLSLAIWGALAPLAAFAVWRALQLAWLSDDSFLSARYAENLARGLGLVYNAGERVEGYTNPLWTLWMATAARGGASPLLAAQAAGIAAYIGLAGVLSLAAWRRARSGPGVFVPLAAGLVLISDDFHVWATGGLETMAFTYLGVHALLLTRRPAPTPARSIAAGALFALLVLTRLDGILLAAAGVASFWIPRARLPLRARLRHAGCAAAPVALVLAVSIPARLAYYGDWLPTAFYSKSVLHPYPSQGVVYLGLYLAKNWYLGPAAVAAALVCRRLGESDRADVAFWLGAAGLYAAYVIEAGGDFMFARRLVPVAPLVFLAIEQALGALPEARQRRLAALATLAAAALPVSLYGDAAGDIAGVYDERRSYPPETLALRKEQARLVGEALVGTPVRVAFEGGMCSFGYYSQLPYLAEMTGLTQYSLAKQPLAERGVPGHEKAPDDAWFEANGIHLLVRRDRSAAPTASDGAAIDQLRFGDVARAQILLYADEVMDPLREAPGVSFVPIEEVIERFARQMEASPAPVAERLFAQLDRYYFHAAGERGRAAADRLRAIVEARRSAPATPPTAGDPSPTALP